MSPVNDPERAGMLLRLIKPKSMFARLFWFLAFGILISNGFLLFHAYQQTQRQERQAAASRLGFQLAPAVSQFLAGSDLPSVRLETDLAWQIIEPGGRTRAEVLQAQGMAGWVEHLVELPVEKPTPDPQRTFAAALAPAAVATLPSQLTKENPRGVVAIAETLSELSTQAAKSGRRMKLILDRQDGRIMIAESPAYWSDEGALSRYDFLIFVALIMFFMGLPFVAGYIFSPMDDLLAALKEKKNHATPIKADGSSEVSEISVAINRLVSQLARTMSERLSFVAAISHDLGVPATRLRLRAQLIKDRDVRDRLIADTNEMSAMIADSLHYLRNDTADEAPRVVDFQSLVESLHQDYLDMGGEVYFNGDDAGEDPHRQVLKYRTVPSMFSGAGKRMDFQTHGPLTLTCKPRAMRRALGNLVDNAIKYGGAALLELDADASSVLIKVSDRGPGIPEAEMENVVRPFYRLAKSRGRNTGGTGLGLAIVNSIVKDHDGFLAMENLIQGGLQVTVALPRDTGQRRGDSPL